MEYNKKSVSKLSQHAASQLGESSSGTGVGSTRSTREGSEYHSGSKTSFFLRRKQYVIMWVALIIMVGVLSSGFLSMALLIIGIILGIFLSLYYYWSSQDILSTLPGRVWYDDTTRVGRRSYLQDDALGLHGSPDYIMEYKDKYYVVEYKTTVRGLPRKPSYKHLTQLVAYHVMLEKKYVNKMHNFGYLIYQSRASNRIRRFRYTIDNFMKQEIMRNLTSV